MNFVNELEWHLDTLCYPGVECGWALKPMVIRTPSTHDMNTLMRAEIEKYTPTRRQYIRRLVILLEYRGVPVVRRLTRICPPERTKIILDIGYDL